MLKVLYSALTIATLINSAVAYDFGGNSPMARVLNIDFSKNMIESEDAKNEMIMKQMKDMSNDFCKIQGFKFETLFISLFAISNSKSYDYLFTFIGLDTKINKKILCNIITDKKFNKYSGSCRPAF